MNECARASALLLLFFGCGDGDRSKAEVPTASSSSSVAPSASAATSEASRFSSSTPVVARRVSKLPEDPDPLSLAPMPRALDPQIACATPRVPGRRLPKGASPRVRGLYDACRVALDREPSEASPKPSGENGDPSAPSGLRACTALRRILNRGFGAPENATLGANLEA